MLALNTAIDFGGGEPTVLPDFVTYLDSADRHKWNMTISTSAILFSENIALGLKKGLYKVHISPDAGTEETYYKIKGQHGYKKVWENINEYCRLSEKVFVRYILFSMNSSKEEIDKFVEMCLKNNVKNIVISAEHEAVRGITDRIHWSYGEDEYKANAYMVKECMKCGFATHVYLSGMSSKYENQVLHYLAEGLNEFTNNGKVFVFGIGKNGKSLIQSLTAVGVTISGVVDNYVKMNEGEYQGIPQVEYGCIDKEKDTILISPDNYKEIEGILSEQGYKRVYNLYLD
jgi:hypothetical protein